VVLNLGQFPKHFLLQGNAPSENERMNNKLLISTAVLAAAIVTAACDKTPSGETDRSGSARVEADEHQRTEPQQHSGQIPSQAASGETEQQSNPSREQGAKASEDRNSNGLGEQSQQNRTTAQRDGGPLKPGSDQSNQAQQDQAQPDGERNRPRQNQQARGTTNLSPENNGNAASDSVNLSRVEIRQVQIALKKMGFDVGEAEGVLSPSTRGALITFQAQQGLEPTGKIDQPTITALELSNPADSTPSGQARETGGPGVTAAEGVPKLASGETEQQKQT
jgi:hypothetical protein